MYVNTVTGQIRFDPRGLSVSTFILTYTPGTVNISASTPGPFQYTTGTGDFSYSDIAGTPAVGRLKRQKVDRFHSATGNSVIMVTKAVGITSEEVHPTRR